VVQKVCSKLHLNAYSKNYQIMKKAFSLIELSIVLLIIGIIIAGVTQSSSLLKKAKIQSSQTLTKNSPVAGIEGLLMWFEPILDESFLSSEAEEGQVVTRWNDINPQSSNKLDMTNNPYGSFFAVNQFYKESAGPGGLPSVYFDDTWSGNLSIYEAVKTPKQTLFMVLQMNAGGEFEYYDPTELFFVVGDPYKYYPESANGFGQFASDEIVSTSPIIVSVIEDGGEFKLYINGSNVIDTDLILEWGDGNSQFWGSDYYLSEFIRYDSALKNSERKSIEQYLGKKYGIGVAP
jgi:prepilin-type N-terminal cleavage/methylation domain-containing protein